MELNHPVNLRVVLLPAALCAALLAPAAVFAQQAGQTPAPGTYQSGESLHQGHRHGFMGMLKGVNLSDQQKSQIKQIVQNFRQTHREGSPTDPQARRTARQQLRDQVMNVLTPQQRTQVQQNMQQMRERRQKERDGDGPPAPAPSSTP